MDTIIRRTTLVVRDIERSVAFYRDALAGRHPHLELENAIELHNFMPELLLHRALYGTFQLFVGDIQIYRVVD